MSQSPPKPWIPGKNPGYTAFQLVVNICQDSDGNVWSDHDFATPEDQSFAQGLPQAGLLHITHALLSEAVRREVLVSAMIQMSQNASFLKDWASGDAESRKDLEAILMDRVHEVLTKTIGKMLPGAILGILEMMRLQVKSDV